MAVLGQARLIDIRQAKETIERFATETRVGLLTESTDHFEGSYPKAYIWPYEKFAEEFVDDGVGVGAFDVPLYVFVEEGFDPFVEGGVCLHE